MMTITGSKRNLLIVIFVGVACVVSLGFFKSADENQSQKILAMEAKIKNLEALLEKREDDLNNARLLALRQNAKSDIAAVNSVAEICKQVKESNDYQTDNEKAMADIAVGSAQMLKDLGTYSVKDPRSFSEKVSDLLAGDSSKENIAVVSKSIFDRASDRENLPDYELQSIYNNQADPELKRVIAQVLSNRGNNALMDNQIAAAQTRLISDNPNDRQHALTELAKTHSSSAANAIIPLLNDSNIDVKLNALLALKATGNQTHIHLVEQLVNDADPAVSALARDVISDLKNLSDSARTVLSSAEIAAELPLIEHP